MPPLFCGSGFKLGNRSGRLHRIATINAVGRTINPTPNAFTLCRRNRIDLIAVQSLNLALLNHNYSPYQLQHRKAVGVSDVSIMPMTEGMHTNPYALAHSCSHQG